MTIEKKILVCGASIAGTAIAFWLARYGYQVVVAERFKSFRDGGQNVDIKDFGQDVLKRMGIDELVSEKNTGEVGLQHVNKQGKVIAAFPKGAVGGLTSDYEILRGDLACILYEKTKAACEYRFGKFVSSVTEHADGITVMFNDGNLETFAFVVCAEGIGSSTRNIVMPELIRYNYLGAYMSFFTIPKMPADDLWAKAYQCKGGSAIFLRPGHPGETTVSVTFRKQAVEPGLKQLAEQKAALGQALSGKGGIADRVSQALDQVMDIYFGPMSQVKASRWHKGKVVLLGDAAHAPTPFTGMGTALALMGAYILAGELRQGRCIDDAFQAYERIFKPFVDQSQAQITPQTIRLLHPRSTWRISATRLLLKVVASRGVQKWLRASAAKGDDKGNKFVLPVYQAPVLK